MEYKPLVHRADAHTSLHTATSVRMPYSQKQRRPYTATSVTLLSHFARAPDILPGISKSLTTNTSPLLPTIPPISTATDTSTHTSVRDSPAAGATAVSHGQGASDTHPVHDSPRQQSPALALAQHPPPGCVTTFRKGFTINSYHFSNEFIGSDYLNLYKGALYVVGRGLAGYITDDYELKFHRLPGPGQLLSRPFSMCNNNTIVFSDRRTWYICTRKSGRFLSLNPPSDQDCSPTTLHARFYKLTATRLIAPLRAAANDHNQKVEPPVNEAAIAGICVGGAVVITLLVVILVFLKQRRQWNWNWKRIFSRRPRAQADPQSPIHEKDSVQKPAEVDNRPPTDMIDSTPLAELPGVRNMAELPTDFNEIKAKKLVV